ncbi:HlyC/CorC family transporter [Oceanibacterium hippocampi]|uniref:Magnesium and cobalt efflux protein CorC n=1 Tax=Oceanibacterium hippocampi TaxID=745714 RepID=A0A1Y5S989_9PROT|nr:HlyC/CorC family transporter [Oceanibacterium hippocampi]SLN32645.1 Magnesium and cobalt efflux protein CorC [Oceanibacterium hippocampi]
MILSFLAIVILLLLSAFFSGSETALTAASRARLHMLEQQGDGRAQIVNQLRERKERLIGGILLGNNLVNILASAIATNLLVTLFGAAGVAYATVAMTLLVLVFAEVLPKTYALRHPIRTARTVAPVIRPVITVLSPLVHGVDVVVSGTLQMLGARAASVAQGGADELRGVIALQSHEGGVAKEERYMLNSILGLDEIDLSEIMVHRKHIMMVDASLPTREIVRQVLDSPFTRIPLWRDEPENIVGILHAKNLLRALSDPDVEIDSLDVVAIAAAPWFVPETTTLREQLNAFLERHSHFAFVVDEYGALMGLVTLEDILEEIVGEISDEHDIAATEYQRQPDGSYIVVGTTAIRDLNRALDWKLPDDEATTVAGLVIHEAQIIPVVGQIFSFYGFRFEILKRQRNQITSLRVTPAGTEAGPA